MLNKQKEIREIVYTVAELLKADRLDELTELLNNSQVTVEQTDYDYWHGETYFYTF